MGIQPKMNSSIHGFTAIVLVVSMLFLPLCLHAEVFLWPQPQRIDWTETPSIPLSSDFVIDVPQHFELHAAAKRYTNLIKTERWLAVQVAESSRASIQVALSSKDLLTSLEVTVYNLTADLQHGVDESYVLKVKASPIKATLYAVTAWGAMRGLETFSQLVHRAETSQKSNLVIDSAVYIEDYPLFPHRGVLLDVARNFYPVSDIKRTIRALSYNKLNVLHLHITDSQSFPLEIEHEPELSRKGSYGPQFVYTRSDIKGIIRYGRLFGVRVVPEIDLPGHTASWDGAYPEIVTCRNQFWLPEGADAWGSRYASEPGTGQLNPLVEKTYEVVENVFNDVATLFTDDFFHAGCDEIAPGCWLADSLIKDYVGSGGPGKLGELLTKFIARTRPVIDKHQKTTIYWEDVLLDSVVNVSSSYLPTATTIFQSWNNGPLNTKILTAAGYRTIVSSFDHYYLDCGHGGWVGNDSRYDQNFNDDPSNTFNYNGQGGSYCAPFKTWARIYDYDITANLTQEEASLVLGGEVALWSEQSDSTVLDARLWPRTSAMAESLWSGNREVNNPSVKRYADALNRLNDWRYRLVHRGIGAEPLQPLWCLKNPRMCNFVY